MSSDAKQRAQADLLHYLQLCFGHEFSADSVSEIESVVDNIIEAAVEELKDTFLQGFDDRISQVLAAVQDMKRARAERDAAATNLDEEDDFGRPKRYGDTQPMQPIVWCRDPSGSSHYKEGHIRFRPNAGDMVQVERSSVEYHEQFAQLIGYSVSGAGDLSYFSHETCARADAIAEDMVKSATVRESPDEVEEETD
jgi:hypothetical protein